MTADVVPFRRPEIQRDELLGLILASYNIIGPYSKGRPFVGKAYLKVVAERLAQALKDSGVPFKEEV